MPTLFDRVGGFAMLSKIVLDFYDRVLDDDVLAPFFEGVDMRRLIDHQTKFMAFLMDGPASYTDDHLRLVHQRLDIDQRAFDRAVALLESTLEDYRLSDGDIALVVRRMQARRDLIVSTVKA